MAIAAETMGTINSDGIDHLGLEGDSLKSLITTVRKPSSIPMVISDDSVHATWSSFLANLNTQALTKSSSVSAYQFLTIVFNHATLCPFMPFYCVMLHRAWYCYRMSSVRQSVTLRYCTHIGRNSSKLIFMAH